MAASPSSSASSMLMSMAWAPLATCWRAISTASSYRPSRISRANAREPITLVRSPTLTNRLRADVERLEAGQVGARLDRRAASAARGPATAVGDGLDVGRRRAAAATDDVECALAGELAEDAGGLRRLLVVAAEGVGQAGVWVGDDRDVGDARQFLDVRPQHGRAKGAVQPNRERPRMADAVPERTHGLPRQRPARRVRDGAADDHRDAVAQLVEERLDGEDRRLAVERVEDGFDEQDVGAALDQAARRVVVGADQLLPRDVAGAGVVDVGRDGGGLVGRAKRTGNEAWSVRCFIFVGNPPGNLRRRPVHLLGVRLELVVGQRDRVAVERVRADDVGAGVEVLAVDAGDDLGLGQHQEVVLATQVAGMVGEALAAEVGLGQLVTLDERAHRAVEHQNSRTQKLGQAGVAVVSGTHLSVECSQPRLRCRNERCPEPVR